MALLWTSIWGLPTQALAAADAGAAAKAVNSFAVSMYGKLAEGESDKNFFFSPWSVSSAMGMLYAGANGATADEIGRAMSFQGPDLHESMRALRGVLSAAADPARGALDTANRLWVSDKEAPLPAFTALLSDDYGADVGILDFKNQTERSRQVINGWVEEQTRDKIKNLLQNGDLTNTTRFILTNAVYFKSAWLEPLSKRDDAPFRTRAGASSPLRGATVPMMGRTDRFLYGEADGAQFVKLPYTMRGVSMLVILPRVNGDFTQTEKIEAILSPEKLSEWTSGMTSRRVALSMPKFRVEGRYELNRVLMSLGMKLAFTGKADFSNMVSDTNNEDGALQVDKVIHQTFIDVDEKGTEAAAATAIGMVRATAFTREEEPIEFRADHPFIYCIMEGETGAVLFMGRCSSPGK
jgi:serpin B